MSNSELQQSNAARASLVVGEPGSVVFVRKFGLNERLVYLVGILAGVAIVLHTTTLHLSPAVWIDEVMILDYGRVLHDLSTDWGVTLTSEGKPAVPLSPLYCYLEWGWVRITGCTVFFVRLFALLVSLAMSMSFFGFLKAIGLKGEQSALVAFALWCDVVLVGSFRGARADCAALALVFLGAVLLARGFRTEGYFWAFVSGASFAAALLTWPTALATMPIVLAVFPTPRRDYLIRFAIMMLFAFIGAAIVIAVWAGTYWYFGLWDRIFWGTLPHSGRQAPSLAAVVAKIVSCYRFTPWMLVLLAVGIISLFRQRKFSLLIAFAVCILTLISVPPFYRWRVAYLSPFFYVIPAQSYRGWRWFNHAGFIVCVLSFLVTVTGRFATAVIEFSGRDYSRYERQLAALIPPGTTVFTDDYAVYYAALARGWKLFVGGYPARSIPAENNFYLVATNKSTVQGWERTFKLEPVGLASTAGRSIRSSWRSNYRAEVFRVLSWVDDHHAQ
jgi:hypothetical protein